MFYVYFVVVHSVKVLCLIFGYDFVRLVYLVIVLLHLLHLNMCGLLIVLLDCLFIGSLLMVCVMITLRF